MYCDLLFFFRCPFLTLWKSMLTRNCATLVSYKLFIPFQQNNINCIHNHNKKE